MVLAVRKAFPANNLREFVTYAKANESKLNMGHAGVGSVSYTFCLMLNHEIGIKPTLVPFTGKRHIYGFNNLVDGAAGEDAGKQQAVERARTRGFKSRSRG